MGGDMVKVERRDDNNVLYQADDRDPNHVSECDLSDYSWDATLVNRGIEPLRAASTQLFAPYIRRALGL